ncbi:hypothetical protein EDD22DRAFT_1004279 [Suillus occidentalis]|nr:hypothetical protein EDD22DRAFT_1004279 [Suillus occidentalis]
MVGLLPLAQTLIKDYALSHPGSYHGVTVITRAIQEHLSNFKAHIANVDGNWKPPFSVREITTMRTTRTCGRQTPEDLTDDHNHNQLAPVKVKEIDAFDTDKEMPHTADEIEIDEKTVHEDLRILIKLDIILRSMKLDDQFEWDLEIADASPSNLRTCMQERWDLVGNSKRPPRIAHVNKF